MFHFGVITAQKMKFSLKDFFSICDQIRSFLRIWSHLLKRSLMKNFIFLCSECSSKCWLWFFETDSFSYTFVKVYFMFSKGHVWSISVKSSIVKCLSQLSRKDFEYSCHQVANFQSDTSKNITITVTGVVLMQLFFLTVGSEHKKIKMQKQNTMAPLYHSKFSSTQIREPHFSLAWVMELVLHLHVWVKS